MTETRTKQTARLRLLALVLALAITWYSVNPSPGSLDGTKSNEEPPGERRSEPLTKSSGMDFSTRAAGTLNSDGSDVGLVDGAAADDFEWPEFIDA